MIRNFGFFHELPLFPLEIIGLAGNQVDNSLKLAASPNRYLNGQTLISQFGRYILEGLLKICPVPIHFIDKDESRNLVPIHLVINGEGLGLHTPHSAHY